VRHTCAPDAVWPALHVYTHVSPVTPEHVVGEFAIVSPVLQLFAPHVPPAKAPDVPHTCAPDAVWPALHVYAHVSPVTPEHVVGEFAIVSPVLQLFAPHVPPAKAPDVPHTCAPDFSYPALHVYAHVSPVWPEHVVGEFAIVRPVLQLFALHVPPAKAPDISHTCAPDAVWPALHVYAHVSPVWPEHVVGEFSIVRPVLQLFAPHVPPAKAPDIPHTCAPDAMWPALHVYVHVSPVTPEHVVGEFAIVSPVLQLFAPHVPPAKAPDVPHTCAPDAVWPALHV
jgi:hypothetical protein